MRSVVRAAVGEALGAPVANCRHAAGGDINESWAVDLGDGQRIFVKTNPQAPEGFFKAEADGLKWLDQAAAIRLPEVLAFRDKSPKGEGFLALEYIDRGPANQSHDDDLGRGLAALHSVGATNYGFNRDNYIGTLPQLNAAKNPVQSWGAFYGQFRIAPQVRWATDAGGLDRSTIGALDQMVERMDELVEDVAQPARLHGDLWGGNAITDQRGCPCLIDPAVYGGSPEVDLAMMRLFGGFSQRCFDAYAEVANLSPGVDQRVPLYQLYPMLVHLNLFGGAYLGSVKRIVSRYR